jgi:hypothetical protein
MMKPWWLIGLIFPVCAAAQGAREYTDADTGLDAWEWSGEGIKLQQIQRIPDQTRAFFLGRGFTREEAEHIASACVFQSVFYNQGEQPVTLDLAEWQVRAGNEIKPLKLTADWQQEWAARDSSQEARIAFQWSLFPNLQEFAPGDWNMGMVTYPVAHGDSLDLLVVWHSGETRHEAWLPGLRCAEDKTFSNEEARP